MKIAVNSADNGMKDFMLNQIYPAVLGTFIVLVFEKTYSQLSLIILSISKLSALQYDNILFFKYLLVIQCLAFYFSDYFYIKFTKQYVRWYFFLNVIFSFTLLATIKLIHLDDSSMPNVYFISWCYFTFMLLYLLWDINEYRELDNDNKKEKVFYLAVIIWEVISLLFISYPIYKKHLFSSPELVTYYFLICLFPITVAFVLLTIWKKSFFPVKQDTDH